MDFSSLQFSFNRALAHTFCLKRVSIVALSLAAALIFFVAAAALTPLASSWLAMSLFFIPFFALSIVFMPTAVLLIHLYKAAVKNKTIAIRTIVTDHWQQLITSSYFLLPFLFAYLVIWIILGLFILIMLLPGVGNPLAILLSFIPFILNCGCLLLSIAALSILFLFPPLIALKNLSLKDIAPAALARIKKDPFSNLLLALISFFPLAIAALLIYGAAKLTYSHSAVSSVDSFAFFQAIFIFLPSLFLLAPAALFFFNFSTEAHLLLSKPAKDSKKKGVEG